MTRLVERWTRVDEKMIRERDKCRAEIKSEPLQGGSRRTAARPSTFWHRGPEGFMLNEICEVGKATQWRKSGEEGESGGGATE